jgi:DNA ligase-associated metallophosphoesterase
MVREVHSLFLSGAELQPLLCGALWWPREKTIVVADLHFEKGSSMRVARNGLPPYDTLETLARLAAALEETAARRVVSLGDSFHDAGGPARLPGEVRTRLAALMKAREWVWIEGNHEGASAALLGGQSMAALALGSLLFRHAAEDELPAAMAEVSGHYHPKAAVAIRGRRVTAPCFVHDDRRMILPAFGAYTGGLSVFDPAIRRWFDRDFTLHLQGRSRLFRFAAQTNAAD